MGRNASGQLRVASCQVVSIAVLLAGAVLGPATVRAQAAKAQMMPKDADPDWEVATVRAADPGDNGFQHIRSSGRHVLLLDTTVEEFLLLGYGVQKSQLADVPDWAKTEKWNVDGVPDVEGAPNWAQIQALMRKILAERYGLKVHPEKRELPVYALTVGKGGPKMVVNTSDPNGLMNQQNSAVNGRDTENLKNASMRDLTEVLQFRVGRPVVDRTGLTGRYDFKLQWTTDEAQAPAPDAPPGIFTAIQEQIGLKLEAVKAPTDVVVVDAVEKPGEN